MSQINSPIRKETLVLAPADGGTGPASGPSELAARPRVQSAPPTQPVAAGHEDLQRGAARRRFGGADGWRRLGLGGRFAGGRGLYAAKCYPRLGQPPGARLRPHRGGTTIGTIGITGPTGCGRARKLTMDSHEVPIRGRGPSGRMAASARPGRSFCESPRALRRQVLPGFEPGRNSGPESDPWPSDRIDGALPVTRSRSWSDGPRYLTLSGAGSRG